MKFSIEKKDLIHHIQYMVNIIPAKTTMPILSNFLVEADEEENELTITATDLEITVISFLKANVSESGKVAISARRLLEVISRLPDLMIDFTKQEEEIIINCNSIVFSLLSAETSQFPLLPDVDMSDSVSFKADIFQKMIANTSFAVSNEVNRPIFTGIHWIIDPEYQQMSATDGKKIAEFKFNKSNELEEQIDRIIPTKGLNFLNKVISKDSNEIKVLIEDSRVIFQYGTYLLMSHLIEGRYPDYSKAIPKNNDNILRISTKILTDAVSRVSLLATEDNNKILITIKDHIEIDCINRDEGEANEKITDYEFEGENIEIAFNYKFLLAILNVIETEMVEIRMGKPNEGALLYNYGKDLEYDTRFLLMPLRFL